MPATKPVKPLRHARRSQHGLVFIWTILGLAAIMGMAAWGVDVSLWYSRKASLQSAADSAALAAAYSMASISDDTARRAAGLAAAQKFVAYYGYDPSIVTNPLTTPADGHTNWVSVQLNFSQPNMFRGALGKGSQALQVTATAQWTGIVDSPIASRELGLAPGRNDCTTTSDTTRKASYNFSLFGIYADSTNGDNYGPLYWDSNTSNPSGKSDWLNKWHVSPTHPDDYPNWPGYDFTITPDSDYVSKTGSSQIAVELFDPDFYNSNGATTAGPKAWEEMRPAPSATNFPAHGGETINDVTVFELHWTADDGTDTLLGKAQYDGNSWWSDGDTAALYSNLQSKGGLTAAQAQTITPTTIVNGVPTNTVVPGYGGWVLPASGYGLVSGSFLVDASTHTTGGRLHLNVYTTDGTGENGFSVRAGPPQPNGWDSTYGIAKISDCDWNTNNAQAANGGVDNSHLTVSSHGVIPMNFDMDGTADVDLGTVPIAAAGGTFTVDRFDTDVPASGKSSPTGTYFYYPTGSTTAVYPSVVTTAPSTLPSSSLVATVGPFGSSVNNKLVTDTVYLPISYTGGDWHVSYSAGSNDTSTWKMSYSGGGIISLVAQDGTLY